MKQILQKMKQYALVVLLVLMGNYGWGQNTAIYTVGSTTSVTTTGNIPSGSTATYSQTFTTAKQLTAGKSATLTLSGYGGYKITNIVLEMKSNTNAGAGTLSVVAGSTSISSVSPAANFNTSSWYGGWSTSYVNVTKVPSPYSIASGENVVITIGATVNSLFIQKYSITYEPVSNNDTTSKVEAPTTQISAVDLASTATASGSAVDVFKFKVSDLGSGGVLATKVTQVKIKKASGTADWTDHIGGVSLWDGANQITSGTATITDTDITIPVTSGNLDIGDGTSKEISLKLWLNTTNIVDNATMVFTISSTGHGFISDPSGSSFASDFGSAVTSNTMSVRIEATKMIFTQQPTSLEVNATMTPSVEVKYVDVNNNVDIDATNLGQTATLSATGATFAGTTTTAGTPLNGVMTFSDISFPTAATGVTLTVTDSGTVIIGGATVTSTAFNINEALPATPTATDAINVDDFQFDANWNTVAGATSYRLDVMTSVIDKPFINEFHYDNSTSNDPNEFIEIVIPNSYTGVDFTITLYNGNGGVSYETYTLNDFVLGQSYSNYKVYSKTLNNIIQNGAPDGFSLSDNAGLIEFISYEGAFTATNGPANGATSNDVGVLETNSTPEGSSIQKTGNFGSYSWVASGINSKGMINDSQTINDTYISGFEDLNVGNVSTYNVTGLNQNTTYYYRVRSVNGGGTTISSNVITVQTPIVSTTWNGTTWSNGAPTSTVDAIIDGDFSSTGTLIAKDVTINATRTLTINAADQLSVMGNLVNNGAILFKSDATSTGRFDSYTGSAITGSGTVTMERYIDGKRAYRLLAPGVTTTGTIANNWQQQVFITGSTTGADGFDVTTTGNPSMYTYENTGWAPISNTNVLTLDATKGYRMLIRGDRTPSLLTNPSEANMNTPVTLTATGSLVTGDVTFTTLPSQDYTLVGNPYVSPIDWATVTKNDVAPTYYVWDPNLGTVGQRGRYVSCDEAGLTSIVSGSGGPSSAVNAFIQPGQAFFIEKAVSGTPGSITVKETDKAATFTDVFRTNSAPTITTIEGKLGMNLYESLAYSLGDYPIDGAVAVSGTAFNTASANDDAKKLMSHGEQVAFVRENKQLGVEKVSPPQLNDVLTLATLNLVPNKNYVWSVVLQDDFSNENSYLYDAFTQTYHSLTASGTTVVSFATTADVTSTQANRFKIVFQTSVLSAPDFTNEIVVYPNPAKAQNAVCYVKGISNATVALHNVLGQNIPIQTTTDGTTLTLRPTVALNKGIYVVHIAQDGTIKQVKWIVD